jgi:PAS domain S-box-containing protein
VEYRILTQSGEYKWFYDRGSAVKWDDKGKPLYISGFVIDISERKLAEELLRNSEARYSSMISNISDVIGIMGADGLMKYKSANIEKFFGWLPEERIGTSGFATIHPDDIPTVQKVFYSLIGEDNSVKTMEFRYQCKDGSYKPIELTASNQLNNPAINGVLLNYRDISERKAIEANLEESREKYRGLSEASFESIFLSEKGLCIEQNQAAELMFGYTTEEALTKHGTAWVVPEDREIVMNHMLSGHKANYEAIALRKDGTTFPCTLKGRMMHFKGRDVRVTSLSDITLLKKAELELIKAKEIAEESERKFMSIIQSQAEGIGFVDQNEVFGFANMASERIFETKGNELVGTCLYDYLMPGERNKVDRQTHNRSIGQIDTYELQILTKKGNAKYIHITATPKLDSNNNYMGAYGVFQDITDRKKAEDEVKRVSTRLAMATLAGGVGIWEYDIVNNTMLWDDQMYALYGIKEGDFGGVYETWRAGLHPDDAERGDLEVQMAIRGEKEFYSEFRVIWPDESVHTIKAMAVVKHDETGKALNMVGTNWDITEQKKNEEVLLKARIGAEAANKSKSIFLANMSHEIRTPLNAIIGFSQLMNREQLTDAQKDYVVSIHRSGEHLLKLINDILELSKIEAGRVMVNPTNVDLHSLFADIQMMFTCQAQAKQLQLIFETSADLPQNILVDDNKLRQILINLIGNALKFTDKGEISVNARIDQTNDLKNFLVVEIQDSGAGISEHELGMIFRQFEQASAGIKQSSGTGLGLALSRELAILMGGNITVSSEEGKGSVFTFHVEVKIGNSEPDDRKITQHVIGIDNPQNTNRILVVDDKEDNLKVVTNFLQLVGFETLEAVNGEDAIAKFESWTPHLILMDLRMPVMDGYEAIRRIKATSKGKQMPIIVMSASQFEEGKASLILPDIQGYIRKPFRENELFETIGKVLGIEYLYAEELTVVAASLYLTSKEAVARDLAKLPPGLISQIREAIDIGDFYMLTDLLKAVEPANPELAKHLKNYANNFDHDYLQQIIN